jgi:hypothetical protein
MGGCVSNRQSVFVTPLAGPDEVLNHLDALQDVA